MHKKVWTRIKRAVQKCMAAEGPASPEATELHVAHRQFTRDFKGRAGTRAVLTETLASVTIPAAMKAAMDRGAGNTAAVWLPIDADWGRELADTIQLCLPQGWQRHKADTGEQESLKQVQLNLPFKKADVFRKILKKQTQTV